MPRFETRKGDTHLLGQNPRDAYSHVDGLEVLQRHYQFADLHNGSWYLEILGKRDSLNHFFVREVRDGVVKRMTHEPKPFRECLKIFWERSYKMSIDAGVDSLPPELPKIEWK